MRNGALRMDTFSELLSEVRRIRSLHGDEVYRQVLAILEANPRDLPNAFDQANG